MGTVILKLKPSTEPDLSYELRHAGIKGMRWGVRRFQNEDGTLTEAGKKRYASQKAAAGDKAYKEAVTNLSKSGNLNTKEVHKKAMVAKRAAKSNTKFDVNKEVESDREAAKGILRETGNVANAASNAVRNRRVNVERLDMSKMSDKELRDAVERARLEDAYDRTFNVNRQKVEAGRYRTSEILQNIGIAAGIGISVINAAPLVADLVKKIIGR